MLSIWRESSALALVCEIVRDWFREAIFAVPTPIKASSGTLLITSLIDCGILLFALRPIWLVEAESLPVEAELLLVETEFLPVEAEAVSPFALFEAHDATIKAATRHAHTKRFFFIFLLLKKIMFSYENSF
jgi:hypothetical protein